MPRINDRGLGVKDSFSDGSLTCLRPPKKSKLRKDSKLSSEREFYLVIPISKQTYYSRTHYHNKQLTFSRGDFDDRSQPITAQCVASKSPLMSYHQSHHPKNLKVVLYLNRSGLY